MSRLGPTAGTPIAGRATGDADGDDDICPVCKSSRYLNPNMRFLLNADCYHKMCEACVDRIFSHGPAPCPVAGCHRTLRKPRFHRQTFADLQVEKEVDVRKRVAQVFNRREEEFLTLHAYNDYLEEVETVTFKLLHGIEPTATEARLASYAGQHAAEIARNEERARDESADQDARAAAEKAQARRRREAARLEEDAERELRHHGRRHVIDRLAADRSGRAPDLVARDSARENLVQAARRRRQMRQEHTVVEAAAAAAAAAGNAVPFHIKGLKPAPAQELAYDPFEGGSERREYFALRAHYAHPWLDRARAEQAIVAGGYDLHAYYARALMEAFAGLGVELDEEVEVEVAVAERSGR
ncbi:MAG: TFIIH/NER complex subunit [Phylliscum demangeonii]|nr:MAG: TFIIH/NER complex subunit [Phylliscum demangeonii]